MGGETFLGLDIGTSSVKALLIDAEQRTVAEATAALDVSRPKPLWSEQNPDDWVEGVEATVQTVRRHAPDAFARLAGVGLSGQMHGATFLDAADKPLRPAILWNDGRSFAECAELERRVPNFLRRAGNLAMPGFTAPKAMWVAKHEPEVFAATKRILLPKDYVRLKLSGEAVSDMSDAAGTLWLDIAGRRWDEELIAASGLKPSHMPGLVEGSEVSAYLSPEVAASWGLAGRKIPIAGGGGDNAASAIGVGAIEAGEGFVSLGTSGVVFSVTDKYVSLPERTLHAFCHALPGRWHGMSVMLSAAASLTWVANLLGRGDRIGASVDEAERFARDSAALRAAPIFLPYLSGERTPLDDPYARGVLFGLSETTSHADVARAVMEGVALTLADARDCLAAAGASIDRVGLTGGGAKSSLWTGMIAAATGFTIVRMKGGETGPALGAARLARMAATGEPPEAVCRPPETADVTAPDPKLAAMFTIQRERFKALYSAAKEEFRR
jgi:xylulokinase